MIRMKSAFWLLLMMCLPLLAAAAPSHGYLISLKVSQGTVTLDRATWMPVMSASKPFAGPTAWRVELVGVADDVGWSTTIPSPERVGIGMPANQALVLSFRVPGPASEALLLVRDDQGRIRFSQYIDAGFMRQAKQEHAEFNA